MGSSKEDEKISVDDIVGFLTHFGVSSAIKDYVMEAGSLGRPQRPRPAKISGECDHGAVQVAVEGKLIKSCAVAPIKTTITWKKWILQGITMKTCCRWPGAPILACLSYVASKSEKRAFSELPLFVRPLTISPKAIIKGITSGRRFLKRPGVEVWAMPQLETSATAGVNLPPRRRTLANENA
jgi:hypothetical protein